eukprot:982009-Pelagomonas_calceolata.AAC.1
MLVAAELKCLPRNSNSMLTFCMLGNIFPTFRSVSPAPKKKNSGWSSVIRWLMIIGTEEAFIPIGVTALA